MIEEHEPCLHALDVEPRSAGSGDVVAFTFRLRNHGSRSADAAVLRLMLPPGLEPLGPVEVPLGNAAPGEELRAMFRARVGTGLDDRTELAAQAQIVLPDAVRPTNRCWVHVHTAPRFDGQGSGTHVECVDAETVRVVAAATNEGDGPARDTLLTVRAPAGCVRLDGDGPVLVQATRLEPGETLTGELLARIAAPQSALRADECDVASRESGRRALPVRAAVTLETQLADPEVRISPGRSRVDVCAVIRNNGWVDAHDVPVSIVLPATLRVADASISIDEVRYPLRMARSAAFAPVRVLQVKSPITIRLARVPARGTTQIAFTLACAPGSAPVRIEIVAGERRTAASVHAPAVCDVRLRVVDAPRWVESRGNGRLAIEVFNAGDASHDLSIALESADATADTIHVRARARTLQQVPLALHVAPREGDRTECLSGEVVAREAAGECARLAVSLALRERAWLALDGAPALADGRLTYTVQNVGTTTARDLRAEVGAWSTELEPIPPGDRHSIAVDETLANQGGAIHMGERRVLILPAAGDGARVELDATLAAVPEVAYGTTLPVRLVLQAHGAVEALDLQIDADAACPYVAGSTTIDGRALAESAGATHLHRGLQLRRIAPGTRIEIGWSQLPVVLPPDAALSISGSLCVDGERRNLVPLRVLVRERDPYAQGFATPAYAVDASPVYAVDASPAIAAAGVPEATAAPPPSAEGDGIALALRPDWHDATRRLLQRTEEPGLLPHILALRALFPDRELSGDWALAAALDAARSALRDVFDRLFVKARIPGFPVAADDIEDSGLRLALCALFEALAGAAPGAPPAAEGVWGRIDRRAAQSACSVLSTAPYGAPAVLRTLALLIPTHSDDDEAAAAVARYMGELDDTLRACADQPLEAFDRALSSGRFATLDASREALLGAVAARASRAAPR
jgi:hypothetical protein